jgi:hypothetical protein
MSLLNTLKETIHSTELALEHRYWLFVGNEVVFTTDNAFGAQSTRKSIVDEGNENVILFDAETRSFI